MPQKDVAGLFAKAVVSTEFAKALMTNPGTAIQVFERETKHYLTIKEKGFFLRAKAESMAHLAQLAIEAKVYKPTIDPSDPRRRI